MEEREQPTDETNSFWPSEAPSTITSLYSVLVQVSKSASFGCRQPCTRTRGLVHASWAGSAPMGPLSMSALMAALKSPPFSNPAFIYSTDAYCSYILRRGPRNWGCSLWRREPYCISTEFSDQRLSGPLLRTKLQFNGHLLSAHKQPAPGLPLAGCVALHESLSLSGSQFLHLQMKAPG